MEKKLTLRESLRLGKGWNLMIFCILAMLVTNAGVNDGLNIALPEIAKGAGLDYNLCLSMGTLAGFVGVVMMMVIGKLRDKFGGRIMCTVLFIIFGLTFNFLFLRADNIVMYAISQCIMVSCGQGCFYLCTGPMQSNWFPKKRGVANGISTIGANIGTAVLSPLMVFLLTWGTYKFSLSVFGWFAIALALFAYATLRDDPKEIGMYPDNVTKEVYERDYKPLENQDTYVSDWTLKKIITCKEAWITAIVPGFITLGILGVVTQFVQRNVSLGLSMNQAVGAMTVAGLIGILGSYTIGFLDTRLGTKKACMLYCAIFASGIIFNLLGSLNIIFVYISIGVVGFSLGGSTNMSLSFPASVFGVLDYPKVNTFIFPVNYCIGCLNFLVNALVMHITGSLAGAYMVYTGLFILDIVLVYFTEEGKWDKTIHPELYENKK
ncbi:MFS transporter [Faecalicoccus pleomorphus]|uniref:MFS transporter n=1 Tax=Faecalicoccus pleomorphus TaxID=1323 RepID=UPI00189BCD76|nr:MFS transporter [Faecalicoccus pleomorphus]MDB7983863.1 MFS transporter [Faecalicoccus pleomorphus]